MKPYFDSMFWLPKAALTEQDIEESLRVFGTGFQDSILIEDCWVEKPDMWGVPIAWAIKHGYVGEDQTPRIWRQWPEVDFKGFNDQDRVIEATLKYLRKNRCGRLEAPMGWGKTMAAIQIARRLETNVLLLAHKVDDILKQFDKSALKWFNVECGYVLGKKHDTSQLITLSSMQTMVKRIETDPELLDNFGLLVLDEAHRASCNSYVSIMKKMNTTYKLGISATFRRGDGLVDVWNHYLGDLITKGKKSVTVKRFLDAPLIANTGLTMRSFIDWQGAVSHSKAVTEIAENEAYNNWIVAKVEELLKQGRRPLVTTQRKSQLEILENKLLAKGITPGIYAGGKHRGKTIKKADLIEAAKKPVMLATSKKIGEGTDFSALLGEEYLTLQPLDTILISSMEKDPEQQTGRIRDDAQNPILIIYPVINLPYCLSFFRKAKKIVFDPNRIYQI